MYLKSNPSLLRLIFPSALWRVQTNSKKVYITFDDGPNELVTPWTLDLLKKHNAKASFFLRGDNHEKYPNLVARIQKEGHSIGNHSYSHVDGWKTNNKDYYLDIEKADNIINSKLLRPPYGRIRYSQYLELKKKYSIVMWDVIPGDFDKSISKEDCYDNLISYTKKGSIIALHDYERSFEKLKYCLPKYLEELSAKGFSFEKL